MDDIGQQPNVTVPSLDNDAPATADALFRDAVAATANASTSPLALLRAAHVHVEHFYNEVNDPSFHETLIYIGHLFLESLRPDPVIPWSDALQLTYESLMSAATYYLEDEIVPMEFRMNIRMFIGHARTLLTTAYAKHAFDPAPSPNWPVYARLVTSIIHDHDTVPPPRWSVRRPEPPPRPAHSAKEERYRRNEADDDDSEYDRDADSQYSPYDHTRSPDTSELLFRRKLARAVRRQDEFDASPQFETASGGAPSPMGLSPSLPSSAGLEVSPSLPDSKRARMANAATSQRGNYKSGTTSFYQAAWVTLDPLGLAHLTGCPPAEVVSKVLGCDRATQIDPEVRIDAKYATCAGGFPLVACITSSHKGNFQHPYFTCFCKAGPQATKAAIERFSIAPDKQKCTCNAFIFLDEFILSNTAVFDSSGTVIDIAATAARCGKYDMLIPYLLTWVAYNCRHPPLTPTNLPVDRLRELLTHQFSELPQYRAYRDELIAHIQPVHPAQLAHPHHPPPPPPTPPGAAAAFASVTPPATPTAAQPSPQQSSPGASVLTTATSPRLSYGTYPMPPTPTAYGPQSSFARRDAQRISPMHARTPKRPTTGARQREFTQHFDRRDRRDSYADEPPSPRLSSSGVPVHYHQKR
eukprot:TRINITY_DN276_c0_g1_i1.p2 TRINITY_DN276_c0_g1~~TRINITY_DN276_c0_g1_i1.p2  ORF type:complete len:639 (+),score=63.43 TRINITY_DN276_c0_g1_i1:396-2312(+)